jgi:predicted dehydrogenase
MRVSIIGNGGQSKRIQKILKKKKINFFIYKPKKPNYFDKQKYNDLKKSNVIFITSPNKTHFDYIKKFLKTSYIFCEKPPVNNITNLNKLKKLNNGKIFFNYNFRFSKLAEILQSKEVSNLGNLVYANLISSHGLAQLSKYKVNWRSKIKENPKGVLETVSIHGIDLINYIFGIKKIYSPYLVNLSKSGSSYDTAFSKIITKKKSIINIFSTYNSSFYNEKLFLFENGIVNEKNQTIIIKGPSKNFNKHGNFITPKIIKKYKVNEIKDYELSIEKSVNFFLKKALQKKLFNKTNFNCSIDSNKIVI